MKKIVIGTGVTLFSLFGGITLLKMGVSYETDITLLNIEALATRESSGECNNPNGYRHWDVKGTIFQKKKEFYDCCSILRTGYNPSGNCNGR